MSETTQPDAAETTETHDDERQDDAQPSEVDHKAELDAANDRADRYARELFTARVTATGRLADPTDLPFNAELLDSADALAEAIAALLAAKPHLASRKPAWGDLGAGQTKTTDSGPTFADLFR
ncbi:hypothetical protein [Mycolicibacterium mucogenicum]|uniref:Uncharacterized protein n=1 Tax=Mycolicibacterium mucogenicum TaxID=56689 RepID=A0A4V3AVN1_MYCMU|nr:hypothetical protein [Mycolicibacterium mucogenicum]TDK86276.1 hypothetical protein EUA03_19980 [Mycolicibacterium mucogenicum]